MKPRFYPRLALYIFAFVMLMGCSGGKTDIEQLELAKQAIAQEEPETALIHLKSALQLNPDNLEARYLLGTLEFERGNWLGAEKELRRASQLVGMEHQVQLKLAMLLFIQGKFEQLVDEIMATEDMNPEVLGDIHSYRGRAWLGLGELDKAKAEIALASKLAPDATATLIANANLNTSQGKLTLAHENLTTALELEPQNAEAWSLIANLEGMIGEMEKAEAAYSKAIENSGSGVNTFYYVRRAMLRMELQNYDGAREDIQMAQKQSPNNLLALYAQGLLDFRQKNYKDAEAAFEATVNAAPALRSGAYYLGATQLNLGSYVQAAEHLKRYLSRSPDDAQARQLLALAYIQLNQPTNALEILNPLVSSENPDARVLNLAGKAYSLESDFVSAEEVYERAAALQPTDAALQIELGITRLSAGKIEEGVATLEKSAATNESDTSAELALAYYYTGKNQNDAALSTLDGLEKKLPGNPGTYNLRGVALAQKGDLSAARENFEKALLIQPTLFSARMRLAELDIQEGNRSAARAQYATILEYDESNVAAMVGMAELAQAEQNKPGYLEWLQKARTANLSAVVPNVMLVNHYLGLSDNDKALAIASEAVQSNPDSPELLALLGKVQLQSGNTVNAISSMEKVTKRLPDSADAHFNLARAYLMAGREDECRKSLQKALEIQPEYQNALIALRILDKKIGTHEDALKFARALQKIAPQSASGFSLEGDAWIKSESWAKAAAAYEKAFQLNASDTNLVSLHQALVKENSKLADDKVLSKLQAEPLNETLRLYLASSFAERKLSDQAISQYEFVVEKSPDNAIALNNLSFLYLEQNNPRALELARKAHSLQPEQPVIADTLGWILVNTGQVQSGLEFIREAAINRPDNSQIRYHLAYALAKAGDKAAAVKELRKLEQTELSAELQLEITALQKEIE